MELPVPTTVIVLRQPCQIVISNNTDEVTRIHYRFIHSYGHSTKNHPFLLELTRWDDMGYALKRTRFWTHPSHVAIDVHNVTTMLRQLGVTVDERE